MIIGKKRECLDFENDTTMAFNVFFNEYSSIEEYLETIINICIDINRNVTSSASSMLSLMSKNSSKEYVLIDYRVLHLAFLELLKKFNICSKNYKRVEELIYIEKEINYKITREIINILYQFDISNKNGKGFFFSKNHKFLKNNLIIEMNSFYLNKKSLYSLVSDDYKIKLDKLIVKEYINFKEHHNIVSFTEIIKDYTEKYIK